VGVAYVAAALALGVSFGLDFSLIKKAPGPNLPNIIKQLNTNDIPDDIREECFASFLDAEKPQPGEWLAIWGGKFGHSPP
jgi:hypothetical protein